MYPTAPQIAVERFLDLAVKHEGHALLLRNTGSWEIAELYEAKAQKCFACALKIAKRHGEDKEV